MKIEQALDHALRFMGEVVDEVVSQIEFEPVPTPRQLMGKPYDQWILRDIQVMGQLYHKEGETKPCLLCRTMGEEEIKRMRELESEVQ